MTKKCPNCNGTGCENGVPVAGRACSECGGKGITFENMCKNCQVTYEYCGSDMVDKCTDRNCCLFDFDYRRTLYGKRVLEKLIQLTNKHPSLRIGQLLMNAVPQTDLFYIENDTLLEILERFDNGK